MKNASGSVDSLSSRISLHKGTGLMLDVPDMGNSCGVWSKAVCSDSKGGWDIDDVPERDSRP